MKIQNVVLSIFSPITLTLALGTFSMTSPAQAEEIRLNNAYFQTSALGTQYDGLTIWGLVNGNPLGLIASWAFGSFRHHKCTKFADTIAKLTESSPVQIIPSKCYNASKLAMNTLAGKFNWGFAARAVSKAPLVSGEIVSAKVSNSKLAGDNLKFCAEIISTLNQMSVGPKLVDKRDRSGLVKYTKQINFTGSCTLENDGSATLTARALLDAPNTPEASQPVAPTVVGPKHKS